MDQPIGISSLETFQLRFVFLRKQHAPKNNFYKNVWRSVKKHIFLYNNIYHEKQIASLQFIFYAI